MVADKNPLPSSVGILGLLGNCFGWAELQVGGGGGVYVLVVLKYLE